MGAGTGAEPADPGARRCGHALRCPPASEGSGPRSALDHAPDTGKNARRFLPGLSPHLPRDGLSPTCPPAASSCEAKSRCWATCSPRKCSPCAWLWSVPGPRPRPRAVSRQGRAAAARGRVGRAALAPTVGIPVACAVGGGGAGSRTGLRVAHGFTWSLSSRSIKHIPGATPRDKPPHPGRATVSCRCHPGTSRMLVGQPPCCVMAADMSVFQAALENLSGG